MGTSKTISKKCLCFLSSDFLDFTHYALEFGFRYPKRWAKSWPKIKPASLFILRIAIATIGNFVQGTAALQLGEILSLEEEEDLEKFQSDYNDYNRGVNPYKEMAEVIEFMLDVMAANPVYFIVYGLLILYFVSVLIIICINCSDTPYFRKQSRRRLTIILYKMADIVLHSLIITDISTRYLGALNILFTIASTLDIAMSSAVLCIQVYLKWFYDETISPEDDKDDEDDEKRKDGESGGNGEDEDDDKRNAETGDGDDTGNGDDGDGVEDNSDANHDRDVDDDEDIHIDIDDL